MPPSVDEWLPERHLARFVVEVIATLDLRAMRGSYRGSGEASYHPQLLPGIMVYGYATGVFSSHKLEREIYLSVAFCFVAANEHPDHDTIAAFRRRFLTQIEARAKARYSKRQPTPALLFSAQVGLVWDGLKFHGNSASSALLRWPFAMRSITAAI